MRIVFMGTPDFSVPVLEALLKAGHEIAGVVTQPDKPKGRGKAVLMTPVKEKALEHGLSVYQPLKARTPQFVEILKGLKPDVMVVVAFGQILTKEVLMIPPMGCVNVHASLLPKYRGAAPIQWAIIDGEKETGVTTMMMDEGIDTGDMLEKTVIPVADDETGDSLHAKLSEAGAKLIVSTLKKLQDGTAVRTPQSDEGTCYAKMLKKDMGDIDWTNGKTLKIWKAKAVDQEYEGVCGEVVYKDKDTILVKTGNGCLSLLELQPQGKKRMAADAFLRGYPVEMLAIFERVSTDGV